MWSKLHEDVGSLRGTRLLETTFAFELEDTFVDTDEEFAGGTLICFESVHAGVGGLEVFVLRVILLDLSGPRSVSDGSETDETAEECDWHGDEGLWGDPCRRFEVSVFGHG